MFIKHSSLIASSALVLGLVASNAAAQTTPTTPRTDPTRDPPMQDTTTLEASRHAFSAPARASQIIGKPIVDAAGEEICTISDLAIAPDGEIVAFVEYGDENGMIGIPLSRLRPQVEKSYERDVADRDLDDDVRGVGGDTDTDADDEDRAQGAKTPEVESFATQFDRTLFDSAPSVSSMDTVDAAWLSRSATHFGATRWSSETSREGTGTTKPLHPTGEGIGHDGESDRDGLSEGRTTAMHTKPVLLEEFIGQDVVTRSGEDLGDVEDVAIDLGDLRVSYAIISTGGVLGVGSTLYAVEFDGLVPTEEGALASTLSKDSLENQPVLDLERLAAQPIAGLSPREGTLRDDGTLRDGAVRKNND